MTPVVLVGLALVALASVGPASAATIANGDFEMGTLAGWTHATTGNGDWFAYSTGAPPTAGCATAVELPAAPPGGTWAATTDMASPSAHVLYQDIALEPNAAHTLSFKLYYTNPQSGTFATQPNLDPNSPGTNMQVRVDAMKPTAGNFSVAAGDVLEPLFGTEAGDPARLPPTLMTFDLTPLAGQTVRLRFADVNNAGCLIASVDDVLVKTVYRATAVSGPASNVTTDAATLAGTVNPGGGATTYHFEYGTSTSYGSQTSDGNAGSGATDGDVLANVTGLSAGTAYHYRLVATNAAGTVNGADQMFTTASPAPAPAPALIAPGATTLPASGLGLSSATLNGSVNPNGVATTYRFEYGTSTAYGLTTPGTDAGADAASRPVSAPVASLAPGTAYHYRLVAVSSAGTTSGGDAVFVTSPAPKPAPPRIAIGHRSTLANSRGTRIRLVCRAAVGTRCKGTLRLSATGLSSRHGQAAASNRASFDIAAGKSQQVTATLPSATRRRIDSRGKAVARATATVTGGKTVTRLVTVSSGRS
jgi:hypothetical protein